MNVFSRAYLDGLFEDYQSDPQSLPAEWQNYFRDFDPATEELPAPPDVAPALSDPQSNLSSFTSVHPPKFTPENQLEMMNQI